jgi:NDP-sugar pyrophosphorylase family protein
MKGIILVGGAGTRLRPVTYEIPKPLVPVKKRPIINHLIDLFRRHGIDEIALMASKDHEEDFVRWQKTWDDELPKDLTIFFETAPRGTFGGLEIAREWIGDEPFILSNGDELKDFDLTSLIAAHKEHGALGTIALVEVNDPEHYGVPILNGEKIEQFLEKPNPAPSKFISSGLYVLRPEVFGYADFANDFIMIEKDIFPKLAADSKLTGYKLVGGRWYDCGTLERWEKAMKEW